MNKSVIKVYVFMHQNKLPEHVLSYMENVEQKQRLLKQNIK